MPSQGEMMYSARLNNLRHPNSTSEPLRRAILDFSGQPLPGLVNCPNLHLRLQTSMRMMAAITSTQDSIVRGHAAGLLLSVSRQKELRKLGNQSDRRYLLESWRNTSLSLDGSSESQTSTKIAIYLRLSYTPSVPDSSEIEQQQEA